MDGELAKMKVAPVPRLSLRAAEAAKALGISERSLWTLAAKGEVPFARLGSLRVFPVDVLRRWLARRAAAAADAAGAEESGATGEKISETS